MKAKLLGGCLLLALPLAALPPKADAVMRPIFADNTALSGILDNLMAIHAKDRMISAFKSVAIRSVSMDADMRNRCNNHSRSGAAVEVTITSDSGNAIYYFTTEGGNQPLRLCE